MIEDTVLNQVTLILKMNQEKPAEKSGEKQLFENEKSVVSDLRQLFEDNVGELQLSAHIKRRILKLYEEIGMDVPFSRADIMRITGITSSPAGDLIKKMKNEDLIEPVAGQGKGKYQFKMR